jgi:PmbA protein
MQDELPLGPERCREIFGRAMDAARALGVMELEAHIGLSAHALTRFANNAIHQNVAEHKSYLSVRALVDGRTARASTNRLDDEAIRGVVAEAVAITRLQTPDPDLPPLLGPQSYATVSRHSAATMRMGPVERARGVAAAIAEVEREEQTAAGIFATGESAFALLNSNGLFAHHRETMAQFSVTAMAHDSSGWAKLTSCDAAELDPSALARRAAEKATASRAPAELRPGRYTVILEPAAVLDLVGQIIGDFSATAIEDARSFLNDRVGKKLFGENIHIRDDVYDPRQSGAPFDGEGVPRRRLAMVEDGVVKEIAYSRRAARKKGVEPTGHGFSLPNEAGEAPLNLVIEGGEASIPEMIAGTELGVLVTRLWYIREVDPYEKIMTGMTRDGTFLIENGRIAAGLRNFRFNQSVIELLSKVEAMSPSTRASGEEAPDMAAPAMKVRDFNFTEVTRF